MTNNIMIQSQNAHHFLSREEALRRIILLREQKGTLPPDELDFHGVSLRGLDMSGLNLAGANFSEADLSEADLTNAHLFKAKFHNASLVKAKLNNAEMTGADLSGANMEGAYCRNTGLGLAVLHHVRLIEADLAGATLTKADMHETDLRCAILKNARLREANLNNTDFTGANLHGVDLSLSNVRGAIFDNADLRESRLRSIKNFEKARWIGADIRDINFAGAYLLRRFMVDQNYLKEFKDRSRLTRFVYYVWLATSDCGRSLLRWCAWILLLTVLFAWFYTLVGVDYGKYPNWISPLYYSVVTLTTLGYGDVVPASAAAKVVAMLEVTVGYLMLGGLLSIFANKMARRGE